MKLNTNSNIYTFVYMTIVVVIVAIVLAFANQTLKPLQEANEKLDKQKQILGALKVDFSQDGAKATYESIIAIGDTIRYAKPNTNDSVEVYKATIDGAVKYVLPLSGKGLWGGIGGYLALNEDKNTIYGVNFNHEGETPGLGAKIVEMDFRSRFENLPIRNEANEVVSVAVVKAGKKVVGQKHVDAISGATITSEGVSTMLYEELVNNYKKFLATTDIVENDTPKNVLYIVDGIPVHIEDINPDDIKETKVFTNKEALDCYNIPDLEEVIVVILKEKEE